MSKTEIVKRTEDEVMSESMYLHDQFRKWDDMREFASHQMDEVQARINELTKELNNE